MKVKERQITVGELLTVVKRFFLLIIAAAVVCGAAGYVYSRRTATATYTAVSGVYVHTADVDMEMGSTSAQITLARAHALECKDAIKAEAVYVNIRDYFARQTGWTDLSRYTNEDLRGMLTCNVNSSSQYVEIVVTAPTDALAVQLANATAGVMEVSVTDVISNCRIEPMMVARSSTVESTFSYSTAVLFAVAGAALAYAGLLFLQFIDPRMRSDAEMKEAYGESMYLGCVPLSPKKGGCDHA